MVCIPIIEQPELKDNDIIFRGHCDGECKGGKCRPRFILDLAGGHNKGARVTAASTWTGGALIRVTADKDIEDGVLSLECACGDGETATITRAEASFSLEHRTTAEDVLKVVVTLGVKALVDKIF